MAYHFEKNDNELSFSQHSTISCKDEVSNTNQNPLSKQVKKSKSISELTYSIKSYNQLKHYKTFLKYNVSKCDFKNSSVKKKNNSKFSLFSLQDEVLLLSRSSEKANFEREDLFVNNKLQCFAQFSFLKDNSNVEENKMKLSEKYIKEENEKSVQPKIELSNKTLSETVYSKISKGGRASDKAVIRAIKEKGPNAMDELFSNIKGRKNAKLSLPEINPNYSDLNEYSESMSRSSIKITELPIERKSRNSKSNKNSKLSDTDKQQRIQSISSKSIGQFEQSTVSEIKSKEPQRISALFSDVKRKSLPKNKINRENSKLTNLDHEHTVNKNRKSGTISKDQKTSISDIFFDIEPENSSRNIEFMENLKILNAEEQKKLVPDLKRKEINEKEVIKSNLSKSIDRKNSNKDAKSVTKVKEIELKEHKDLYKNKLIQPQNIITIENSQLIYQEPQIHLNHDKTNIKSQKTKKSDRSKIGRRKSKSATNKDEIFLNDSLKTFDLNICEICNGFLENAVSGKFRCLCDFKNSEQTMWRRNSLERMNDVSIKDRTNMKLGMFNQLSKANGSFLSDLDNSYISPEQKKKLKLLKKKQRKKSSNSFQSPNYVVQPFIIGRSKSV